MRGCTGGTGVDLKRWPAKWQWWSSHYQLLICHFTREGLEYTPLPTVPPPLAGLAGQGITRAMTTNEYF